MGWLEEMARTCHLTFGKLAREALDSEDWPAGEAKNSRSVENLLRLIDRGDRKGQVWLDRRPAVRAILAGLLGVSPESLDPGVKEPEGRADPRVVLTELREARVLDLRREPLYPGIPAHVLDPNSWSLSWWHARPGAGKTLVGRWLEARGLATFVRGEHLADALARAPEEGAVYVEIRHEAEVDMTELARRLQGRKLCVASPFLPGSLSPGDPYENLFASHRSRRGRSGFFGRREVEEPEGEEAEATWQVVETPPAEQWIVALAGWVSARMRSGGGFDGEGFLRFVAEGDWKGILGTPGDYLGLCGVFEKLGERVRSSGFEAMALAFLEGRLDRPDLATGARAWRPNELWSLIVGCAEAAMISGGQADVGSSERDLAAALPTDALPRGSDDFVARLLERRLEAIEEVRELVGRARPTPASALAELARLHLLEPTGEGGVRIAPSWLALSAEKFAFDRLITQPDRGLGSVLLHPHAAPWALEALRARMVGAPEGAVAGSLIRHAVKQLAVANPASVALVEGVFHAVGLALLNRRVEVPIDDLAVLWTTQMALALDRYSDLPPQPRVLEVRGSLSLSDLWLLSCWSISERLVAAGRPPMTNALAPWNGSAWPPGSARCVQFVYHSAVRPVKQHGDEAAPRREYALDTWRLLGRLYRRLGGLGEELTGVDVFGPFRLFDLIKGGSAASWDGRQQSRDYISLFLELAPEEGLSEQDVVDALWRLDPERLTNFLSWELDPASAVWELCWKYQPSVQVAAVMEGLLRKEERIPWERLDATQWDYVLLYWSKHHPISARALALIPESHARKLLEGASGVIDTGALYSALWERFPELCLDNSICNVLDPASTRFSAVDRIPDEQLPRLLDAIVERLEEVRAVEATRMRVMRYARAWSGARGPSWRRAWELMTAVAPASVVATED